MLLFLAVTSVSFSSCQWNLIKTFQIEALIMLITKMTQKWHKNGIQIALIFTWDLLNGKIAVKKCKNLISKSKTIRNFLKKCLFKNLQAHFLLLLFFFVTSIFEISRLDSRMKRVEDSADKSQVEQVALLRTLLRGSSKRRRRALRSELTSGNYL